MSIFYLIGLMGAGKSTVAHCIGQDFKLDVIDTDAWIEQDSQKTIAQIFNEQGEPYFRQYELECFEKTKNKKNTLIATGGGMPCHLDLINKMKAYGIVIWLDIPLGILVERLWHEKNKRPIISYCKDKVDLEAKLNYSRINRYPFYAQAHYKATTINEVKRIIFEKLIMKQTVLA